MKTKTLKLTAILLIFAGVFTACEEKIEPFLNIDKTSITVPAEGGTFTILVSSNGNWTAVVQDAESNLWLTLTKASASATEGMISVDISENPCFTTRSATIKISMESLSEVVVVYQEATEMIFPIEVPFVAHFLGFSCDWTVDWTSPTFDANLIIVNSYEELKNQFTCDNFPAVDFSTQSLLLVYGLAPNDVANVTVAELLQISANDFLLSINVIMSVSTVIDRWTIAIIIPKITDNANIILPFLFSQGRRHTTYWKVKALNIDGHLTNIVSSSENMAYSDILLRLPDNTSFGRTIGNTFNNLFLVDYRFSPGVGRITFSNFQPIYQRAESNIGEFFIDNLLNTARFEKSNNELIFFDAQDNPIIVFINSSNTE